MKAIFLDAGLTLLRADPDLGGVYSRVTLRHGREVPSSDFDRAAESAFHFMAEEHREGGLVGLRTSDAMERESWNRHARRVMDGIPAMAGLDFGAWFEDLYAEFGSSAAWTPFDDARPALEALRARGVMVSVVSNWDARLRGILEGHGLVPLLDDVVISAEIGWRKPHPEIFRRAMSRLEVGPGDVLHVGDSIGDDVGGARAAGIRPVLLDRRSGKGAGFPSVPVIRDLRELDRFL